MEEEDLSKRLQNDSTLVRVQEIHMGQGLSKCLNYRILQLRLTSYCARIRGSTGWSVSLTNSLVTSKA